MRALAIVVVLAALVASCSVAGPGPATSGTGPGSGSPPTGAASVLPSPSASSGRATDRSTAAPPAPPTTPVGFATPSPSAPEDKTPQPSPTATSSPTAKPDRTLPPASLPPSALLIVGSDEMPGRIGSYTYGDLSASTPWLPARTLDPVALPAPRSELRIRLEDGSAIASWSAHVANASDTFGEDARPLDAGEAAPPAAEVALTGPGPGRWVMLVQVVFADGAGDAAYYWSLEVPEDEG